MLPLMGRFAAASVAGLLLLAGCGSTSAPPATPSSISLRAGDVPSGMSLCPQSGDIEHFLQLSTIDSTIYQEIKADWTTLKAVGARSGYMRVFTNRPSGCAGVFATGNASDPTFKVIASLVVEFADQKGAENGFSSAGQFGSAALGGGPGVATGAATGLGQNSMVVAQAFQEQSLYFAYWQHSRFDAVVLGLNLAAADTRRATQHLDARIA